MVPRYVAAYNRTYIVICIATRSRPLVLEYHALSDATGGAPAVVRRRRYSGKLRRGAGGLEIVHRGRV